MSIENVRKLERGIDMSCNCEKYVATEEELTSERVQKLINEGLALEEEAMQSGDIDVLERAFDYFLEEEDDIALSNGGCERLETDIFQYFEWDQIFGILKKKISKLVELNPFRAINFACSCDIEDLKELIQEIPSSKVKGFLTELKDSCREDLSEDVKILLKDM